MSQYHWEPPVLKTSNKDEVNASNVLTSLPNHIAEAIPVRVYTASGSLTVLSVYMCDCGKHLCIDVE